MVDDTIFNVLPLKYMIKESFDLDIETALDGQIAVNMYRESLSKPCQCDLRAYRLIIMDLGMPNMNG